MDLSMGGLLEIYEKPIQGQMYIMGVDSAKGIGGDYSVINVLKIENEHKIKQVAVYRNNYIDPHKFAQCCISVSEYFNKCYMMVENNDVGGQVADTIWYEYEYDKILNCDKKGIGIRATRKSKLAANMLLKRYIESNWLELKQERTIYELSTYEEIKPDVFQAPRTEHDDCITSLLWGLYFLSTEFFDSQDVGVKVIDDEYRIEGTDYEDAPIMCGSKEQNRDDDGFIWDNTNNSNDPFTI